MTHPTRKDLIGYLLGALDPAEQQAVERRLAADPNLRRDLERLEARLHGLRGEVEAEPPPADLAARTCATIRAYEEEQKVAAASAAAGGAAMYAAGGPSRWSLSDLLVAAGVCVAASLLFFPAIASSRFQAQITACQNNLRRIADALQTYNDYHHNYFPPVPTRGKLANAGCYTVLLRDQQLVADTHLFVCPASPLAGQQHTWYVPTRREVEKAQGQELILLRRRMGGSYAYTLGYVSGGEYRPTRNLGRSYFVVMADAPRRHPSGLRSANHGGRGQNVLFEDFHVKYVVECSTAQDGDPFFVNRYGLAAAGVDVEDAVVGGSEASPRFRAAR